jgi:hypothetical protein
MAGIRKPGRWGKVQSFRDVPGGRRK